MEHVSDYRAPPAIVVEVSMADQGAQARMLANRVRKTEKHLRGWVRREALTCYRLYDRDIPEIPLSVDWYDGRLYVCEYKAKREHPQGWAAELATAVARAFGLGEEHVYLKTRERQRGSGQYGRVAHARHRFEVAEYGRRFFVNLSDYLDSGLFLDHRLTRRRFAEEAANRDVLNLFCYTGAFSVYAATAGATRTTSVDLSNTYTAWARENLDLNGVGAERNEIVKADVLEYLRHGGERAFDLAIVDPPTFSNSKSMDTSFEVQRDHVWLLERVAARMRPGGIIYFSNNFRRFKMGEIDIPGAAVRDISRETIPPDFRNKRIHSCFRIELP